jgi:hypothetical protein
MTHKSGASPSRLAVKQPVNLRIGVRFLGEKHRADLTSAVIQPPRLF